MLSVRWLALGGVHVLLVTTCHSREGREGHHTGGAPFRPPAVPLACKASRPRVQEERSQGPGPALQAGVGGRLWGCRAVPEPAPQLGQVWRCGRVHSRPEPGLRGW